jgi:hypothetical protein
VLEKSGLRAGQVSGVFAHGSTALMNPGEPFAAENRRLSILAVRKGLEKVASRGQSPDGEKPEAPSKAKPRNERREGTQSAAKPEPTAD